MSNQLCSSRQQSGPMFHFQHYMYLRKVAFIPMVISSATNPLLHVIFILQLFVIRVLTVLVVDFLFLAQGPLQQLLFLLCQLFQTRIHNYESQFLLYWLQWQ